MKKAESKVYKERLLAIRARLRGDVNAMVNAALARTDQAEGDTPAHMVDVGDYAEKEFTFSLMQNEEEALDLIEDALERIEEGGYGFCVECESKIPKTRLNAIPYTPYCVKCASKLQTG